MLPPVAVESGTFNKNPPAPLGTMAAPWFVVPPLAMIDLDADVNVNPATAGEARAIHERVPDPFVINA